MACACTPVMPRPVWCRACVRSSRHTKVCSAALDFSTQRHESRPRSWQRARRQHGEALDHSYWQWPQRVVWTLNEAC